MICPRMEASSSDLTSVLLAEKVDRSPLPLPSPC